MALIAARGPRLRFSAAAATAATAATASALVMAALLGGCERDAGGAGGARAAAAPPPASAASAAQAAGARAAARIASDASRADPAAIARGRYLARAGDCAACHDAADHTPYAGGQPVNSPFGPIYASNITPDPDAGIGRYSLRQFADALRLGKAADGRRLYPAMPYPSFAKLDDSDVAALYAYFMHGVQPSDKRAPATRLPFPFNQRWGLAIWSALFGNRERFVPNPQRPAAWNRGAYLVQGLGHCGACHTPRGPAYDERGYDERSAAYLTGGVNDHWFAPNLTGAPLDGLGRWSERDIAAFLRTGHARHGAAFASMAPVVEASTALLSDDDLHAIAVYLKSLPAQRTPAAALVPGRARQPPARAADDGTQQRPGAGVYFAFCARCHGADGAGTPDRGPTLAGNSLVLAPDPTSAIRIVVEGSAEPRVAGRDARRMPGMRGRLTSTEIAQVVSFVRGAWGNQAAPVSDREVESLRSAVHR
ncbi:cytochrome c [Burkholderia pseudomallei]|uniref:cytochrome c n=1 Tax=Burkholderia pseudomallei TaxID=28450 RepID=UPI000538E6A5|nr:cytochrome c [Burkholderia pseudomallei]KGV06440.1 cytochrome c family protein [Burkholderia pseudomallei MSHR4503]ONC84479.1 alcohol dehydrogenase [Burkholderia pseudomallei]